MGQIFSYPFRSIIPQTPLRPLVPIWVENPDGTPFTTPIFALLDTGADSCLFPEILANRTGHILKGPGVKTIPNTGIHESSIDTYQHTFIIKLFAPDGNSFVWESKPTLIGCADHNRVITLLGTSNFLSNFKIQFDYHKKVVHIEIP